MKKRSSAPLHDCPLPPKEIPAVSNIVGLALSGGGIRSATFNLGFLQGLAVSEKLEEIDYLSTVSGGGFIGAWWSAWLSRRGRRKGVLFPKEEALEADRRSATAVLIDAKAAPAAATDTPDESHNDPIHFVRLFSNYLTPKTGVMSPDTWRLIAFFVRSLLCTWLALLPLLFAVVLAAQSIFLFRDDTQKAFLGHEPPAATILANDVQTHTARPVSIAAHAAGAGTPEQQVDARLRFLKIPALIFLAVYLTLVVIWVIETAASRPMAGFAVAVLVGALLLVLHKGGGASTMSGSTWAVIGSSAATILVFWVRSFVKGISDLGANSLLAPVYATPADRRTWLTQQQERILKWGTFVGVVLLAAGFGHDIVQWIFFSVDSNVTAAVKKAGGWGALLLTVVSGLYTLIKKAPSTSGQVSATPSVVGRVLMMVAPTLVVVALILGIALLSQHLMVGMRHLSPESLRNLQQAAICLAIVQVVLAIFESFEDPDNVQKSDNFSVHRFVPDSILKMMGQPPSDSRPRPWYQIFSPRGWARAAALSGLATALGVGGYQEPADFWNAMRAVNVNMASVVILGIAGVMSFSRLTWRISLRSARPVVLLSFASATATLCLVTNARLVDSMGCTALLWVTVFIGGVIAFGWLADPNLISLHGFYKARIARAYLGASNRHRGNTQITDAVPGDDIPLSEVWNHDIGGPYHLVNTALNLVGGSDLATSQRLAENFIMSRYHCGSARAGYRCTAEYMSGELSLATAVAISGAAVSPTMGSNTPSAALTLLLSLFNVRLGFWAPTPSGKRWYEGHARLWPFYLLRETFANTGTLGTYCYLTDGGHFDNTALYALIERGCRRIVVCDCGADPTPNFEDIGIAVRRCRIDFGAEINLQVDDFVTVPNPQGVGSVHVGHGYITYQDEHLRLIGLDEVTEKHGEIWWVKPTVTKDSAADVRQYRRAHNDFPQQTTADQWYDESQFESYRRLGYESALAYVALARPAAVAGAAPPPIPGATSALVL
ncbi:MAG: patatin-like phospholipase family protein [Steroidobacteraceae bacterium]